MARDSVMRAKEPRGVFGNCWRACRGAVLMLGIGAGHLLILSVLALLPFLWDAYPRDLPNWTVLLVGLTLVTAAGILTWQSLRSLARAQYRLLAHLACRDGRLVPDFCSRRQSTAFRVPLSGIAGATGASRWLRRLFRSYYFRSYYAQRPELVSRVD